MSFTQNPVATLVLNKPVLASEDHWIVVLEEGEEESQPNTFSEIPLYEGSILRIGRASSNDIVVRSKLASRFHCLLSVTRNGVIVCDLDSLNGSFINGYRVDAPQDISNGDSFRIGPVEFNVNMRLARQNVSDSSRGTNNEIEQVEVVLFFADLCGYKQKLTTSSPEALTPILKDWFMATREIIGDNDGKIDRFLGDGVLAYWITSVDEKAAVVASALKAAEQLRDKTTSLKILAENDSPWKCNVTFVSNSALVAQPDNGIGSSLILGSVLNELFAINTFAKRSEVSLSCNSNAAEFISDTRALPKMQTSAVVGDLIQPLEIISAKSS